MPEYSACILRFVPDPAIGEQLNCGVVVYAPTAGFLSSRFQPNTRRYSSSFADFQRHSYSLVVREFQSRLLYYESEAKGELLDLFPHAQTCSDIVSRIWTDPSLSYSVNMEIFATAEDPREQLDWIFRRYVEDPAPKDSKSIARTDDEIWRRFQRPLREQHLTTKLSPISLASKHFQLDFPYSYRNGTVSIIQPLSLDLTDASSIRDKSMRWIGYGQELKGNRQVSKVLFAVGGPPPDNDSEKHAAFGSALTVLRELPIKSEIYMESEPQALAQRLKTIIR